MTELNDFLVENVLGKARSECDSSPGWNHDFGSDQQILPSYIFRSTFSSSALRKVASDTRHFDDCSYFSTEPVLSGIWSFQSNGTPRYLVYGVISLQWIRDCSHRFSPHFFGILNKLFVNTAMQSIGDNFVNKFHYQFIFCCFSETICHVRMPSLNRTGCFPNGGGYEKFDPTLTVPCGWLFQKTCRVSKMELKECARDPKSYLHVRLLAIIAFISFVFSVSDFTETLSQLYEEHATALQTLVTNYRIKNAELRKERWVILVPVNYGKMSSMAFLFSLQARLSFVNFPSLGNIPTGGWDRLPSIQRCCECPVSPGKSLWWIIPGQAAHNATDIFF